MSILEALKNNKGTVSSALGKTLAEEVLQGKKEVLKEAVELASYRAEKRQEKSVRSGAAKIIECVAMEKPSLVSPYLEKLLPALEVEEPQTRWMVIRTMGLCAKDKPEIAKRAVPLAKKYIREKTDGQLCLVSSADLFLGDYGELSKETTKEAFPLLMESVDNIIDNEHDWIMEALMKLVKNLSKKQKEEVTSFAKNYLGYPRKKTQERAQCLLGLCE